MPAHLDGPVGQFFEYLEGNTSLPMRVAFRNVWLFGPVVQRTLEASPGSNAMLRTTTAVTIFQAGIKGNVLPTQARAVVNFRLLPGDSIADVLEHVRKVVNDPRVKVQPIAGRIQTEASPVSNFNSPNFTIIQRTLAQVYPETAVAPNVTVGATDARHYSIL